MTFKLLLALAMSTIVLVGCDDSKPEVNAKDGRGRSPLMKAATYSPNPEEISALLKAGAVLNARDADGLTPLMHAARFSQKHEVISSLLAADADVNAKDKEGKTPLMHAASFNENR